MNDLYKIYKSRCSELIKERESTLNYSILSDYDYFKDILSKEDFDKVLKVKHSRNNKRNRTKNKIFEMFDYWMYQGQRGRELYLVFGTGTIDNDYLWERQPRTRDKLLNSYLLKHYDVALVNKDYGDKTDREHYHWIGITKLPCIPKLDKNGNQLRSDKNRLLFELNTDDYKLGYNPTVEPIVTTEIDSVKNYLLKLNNHSNKASARRVRMIKGSLYKEWDLLVNDRHQELIRKRVVARRKRQGKEDTIF